MRHIIYCAFLLAACGGPKVVVTRPAIPVAPAVHLAADVVLPADRAVGGVPTVLIQTRYWRSFRMRGGGGPRIPQGPREPIVQHLVRAGFAVVVVDVRGTGASDAVWSGPWSTDEVQDMRAILDWIVAQPWSNGAVGATGVSYEGTTALLTAGLGHPALKAVLARQLEWQLADETLAPGGVRNALFADAWGHSVNALDHGRYPDMFPRWGKLFISGVARRDDDVDGSAQRQREVARPSSDIADRVRAVYSGSDPFGAGGLPTDSLGPAGHTSALARTSAVVSLWGSWWDGGTADAVFRADTVMPLAEAVIGGWTHEGDHNASPLRSRRSVMPTVALDSVVAFFARTVRAEPVRPDSAARVRWYVAGREAWRSAATWPRTTGRRWMLRDASPANAPVAVEAWQSTGNASTGTNTRWTTGLARPVDAPERANAVGVHRYRLPVLTDSLEVFGAGTITCALAADRAEATLHVYLEAEDAAGRVRLLTEGMQRVRRVDASGDTLPDVSLRLRPVAFALPAGWRLLVTFAGEDRPTFERVPETGVVTWRVAPSRCQLELPGM